MTTEPRLLVPDDPPHEVLAPTLLGEYLMVDRRLVRAIARGSVLWHVLDTLSGRRACGAIHHIFLIDLSQAHLLERAVILHAAGWPRGW